MSAKFELVVSGSGLEPERQLEIRAVFEPFAVKLQDWSGKVAGVTDPKIARETRLAMRRERIDLEKQHEAFKSFTLAWTRAVDGSRRVITEAYDQLEAQMADVEKAEERRIAAAKAALKAEALAAEQRRLAAAPDAAKIHAWAESIAAVPVPTLSTKEAQDLAQAITAHLTKTIANMHARAAQMEDAQ